MTSIGKARWMLLIPADYAWGLALIGSGSKLDPNRCQCIELQLVNHPPSGQLSVRVSSIGTLTIKANRESLRYAAAAVGMIAESFGIVSLQMQVSR